MERTSCSLHATARKQSAIRSSRPEGIHQTVKADPLGARQYGYGGFHELAWREEAGERIELRYDSESELIAVINEDGETYAYSRDACGRIKEERTFEGRRRTFTRDLLGRVTMEFLPDDTMRTFAYDVLGNVTKVLHPDSEEETYAHDVVGNLTRATNPAGTATFERDARGRLIGERFGNDWVASTRDSLGRRVEVATSRGLAERIARTAVGDVQAVGVWERDASGNSGPKWHVAFERDAAGAELGRRMPGGVEARWVRDAAGRPSSQVITRRQDLVDRTDYQWAGLERLAARTDAGRGRTDYLHDPRGRLAGARTPDGKTMWRAPSRIGNLFKTEDRRDRRYGKGGVLLEDGGTTYAYDASGNVIQKHAPDGSTWKYAWNGAAMLARVELPDGESVAFAYDALGRRVSKTCGSRTTRWLWDGNVPVHEWTRDDGALDTSDTRDSVTTWLFEPETFAPLAKLTPDGKRISIVTDYLGTPREMFDEAGNLAWKAQLDVYGVAKPQEGAREDCPWRSAGQYEDVESGLYYNRFRYYDPNRGDYISQDPVRLRGGTELYGYVRDPLIWVDPLGLTGCQKETEPTLPDKEIASGQGVTIEHYYRSDDHGPAHAHVKGGGSTTRIGPNGKPLAGDPELTAAQRQLVEANKAAIRRALGKIGRWLAFRESE
jgi:RHS repeat-associated protein